MLIGPCDSEVIWNEKDFSHLLTNENFDAVIWTFRNNATVSRNPNMYGWVGTKNNHTADFISCKKSISDTPVSDHAIVGIFWFKSANTFFTYGKKLIKIRNGVHSLSRKSDLKKICNELNQIINNHTS